MTSTPERMSNHWWWRSGVRPGRRLLVWHILPEGQPDVHDLVRHCQGKLGGLNGLDLIPVEWLHMTTQIVGFEDEIPDAEVGEMVAGVAERLVGLAPIEVELGRVWLHSEAIMLGIRPPKSLDPVREAIRESAAGTVCIHQLADEPDWTPHISVAYSNTDGPASPVVDALSHRPKPVPLQVGEVHLVAQEHIGRSYQWERRDVVGLGG
ncbi:2'-5' RNA ligase family protein [Actinomadura sp. WMMB 499]|uniref:2'-5' RNA ligase family protein n=1 Tax=Actinomadura sp. WMMB 499 TaxID=1219491 RepID=UPI00159DDF95|nr:2'-5' RNA ligase family protein [Actinomadura sp. WMMB 499]